MSEPDFWASILQTHEQGLHKVSTAAFELGVESERTDIINLILETINEFDEPSKRAVLTYLAKKIKTRA